MTIREKSVDVEGLPVHYFESGEQNGRTILLLAGGIGDACANWQAVLPELAQEYHVYAPDLPGYGASSPLLETSIDTLIHWLKALLDALGEAEAVIVGSFLGALIARLFAAAHPQYVPALILVNGGGIPDFPLVVSKLVDLPLVGSAVLELFGRFTTSRKTLDELITVKEAISDALVNSWHQNHAGFRQLIRAMITAHYPELQAPPVATLLLWGTNDPMLSRTAYDRLKVEIPDVVLAPIENCGLLPQIEASDVFAFQVMAFLEHLTRATLPVLHGVGMLKSRA